MAKSGKTSKKTNSKGKKSKQYTKRAGCKNVAPIFFTGGSSSPDLPYPLNPHDVELRGISTRIMPIMPNMTGGKSKRKRKGKRGTRKRISKK
jgi:hypothetical protein